MNTLCGANCDLCSYKDTCKGCIATGGKPFGGTCVAAEYIKVGGKEKYAEFKQGLLEEINALLSTCDIPPADVLYELHGAYVNLPYRIPSGETVKFLDDTKIYLGRQIEVEDQETCFGVVADTTFILICSYETNGTNPELILYKKR